MLSLGVALVVLLTLTGCSETENGTGGSESGNSGQGTAQETTVVETTVAPTTSLQEEEQDESGDEDQDRQGSSDSSGNTPSRNQDSQTQPVPAPEPEQDSGSGAQSSGGEESGQATGLASRGQVVTVTRVVDGDTIEVSPSVDGIQDVRLISMDTPETYSGTEPLGEQASSFATDALSGEEVAL